MESANAYGHSTNVSFLKDDPLNTIIVNSIDERPLYEVHTPWKFFNRTTTIRRLTSGVALPGEIIAEIHWHLVGASTITFHGAITLRVKDWLRSKGMFSASKIVIASNGSSYEWSGFRKFLLKSVNTDAHVAQSHRGKSGWLWGTPRMNIDISPHGMHFIDTIIMSFIVMEKYARQRHRAQPRRTGRPEDNLTEKPPQER